MKAYAKFIIRHRKIIISLFVIMTAVCAVLSTKVGVNYDFADYLPEDASSTIAIDVMEEEYDQAVPNMRVMLYDVSIPEALEYKEKIQAIDGVEEVLWLDDSINIYSPLEQADQETIDEWYKDSDALFSVTINEEKKEEAVYAVRDVIGDENAMSGTAVTDIYCPASSEKDVQKIVAFIIPLLFFVLLLTTTSWAEPVLFMICIGVAVVMNMGTNLMFGTISFVTNAAGSVLQMAVSMDYSIFLLHRFEENRAEGKKPEDAMVSAIKQSVGSVLSSGLTTVTGFAALILMQFGIGPDMGWVMVKAIILSLISVLCLLPAMTISCYKWIDKTKHRPLFKSFDKFSRGVMKIRIPVTILVIILTIPCMIGQGRNSYLYGGSRVYSTEETQMGRDLLAIEEAYGSSNPVVIMVPKDQTENEIALNNALEEKDYVTSIISYIHTVGASIPAEFVPSEELSQLYSENYSRIIVTLDAEEGIDGWDLVVEDLRNLVAEYYGDEGYIAGDIISTADLKYTITDDNTKVNAMAIGFVFLILLLNFKSVSIPVILTIVIEAAIWINLGIPYFYSNTLHYIAYLIISSVQLGATIDYAILFTDRYMESRKTRNKKEAARHTIEVSTLSVLTSATILAIAGELLKRISTNLVISQLGLLVGRGAILSFLLVLIVLPALLVLFDGLIQKTTLRTNFYKEETTNE